MIVLRTGGRVRITDRIFGEISVFLRFSTVVEFLMIETRGCGEITALETEILLEFIGVHLVWRLTIDRVREN